MSRSDLLRAFKILVVLAWIALFVAVYHRLRSLGVPIREYPLVLRHLLRGAGVLGPLILLSLYAIRSAAFIVPGAVLTLVAGSVYGPVWGTLLNIAGENLSATVGFGLSRLVGRRFVREHESGWLKRYDEMLRQEGFLTVLLMRLFYFPFDLVNYGAGVSGMVYRQYALGTLIGTLPPVITVTVLGGAFTNPRVLVWFSLLFVLSLGGAILLRRSAWVKKRLYPEHVEEKI